MLLHGAFAGAASLAAQSEHLVLAGYKVYAPERRGHAHTADVPGPMSYAVMAQDTIAYLEAVACGPAHLVGWSDGAVVALLLAARRPDLVDRMVLIGQYLNSAGKAPNGIVEQLIAMGPAAKTFLRVGYDSVSPDGPDHFDVVFAKTMAMLQTEPELGLEIVGTVQAPTLVLQGDRDDVNLEHSAAIADALPRGRLAVLPGTHLLPLECPDLVSNLIVWFLRSELADQEGGASNSR